MSDSRQETRYEVARKGSLIGVYRQGEIASLIDAGSLRWTDDCWTDGMESWSKLDDKRQEIEAAARTIPGASVPRNLVLVTGIALSTLIVAGLMAFLLIDGASDPDDSPGPRAESIASPLDPRKAGARKKLAEIQQQVSTLVAGSFKERKSGPSGPTSYSHRFYENVGNRIPLRVHVGPDGECHLHTFYVGKSWIFHNQLQFSVDRQVFETRALPAHKPLRRIGESNLVSETCRFRDPDDVKLVEKLAAAHATPITMRMLGRRQQEVALSLETREAVHESHALSALLKERRQLIDEISETP